MTSIGESIEVYSWDGPPKISVSTMTVEHNGRKWLQHVVEGSEGGNGVVVVPVSKGRLLLVKHFRPATGITLIEFPRGFGKAPSEGVTASQQACREGERELREETGHDTREAVYLGDIWPDSGLLGTKVSVVCIETTAVEETFAIDHEVDSVIWVSLEEMIHLINSGHVRDGITLAAFSLWWSQGAATANN